MLTVIERNIEIAGGHFTISSDAQDEGLDRCRCLKFTHHIVAQLHSMGFPYFYIVELHDDCEFYSDCSRTFQCLVSPEDVAFRVSPNKVVRASNLVLPSEDVISVRPIMTVDTFSTFICGFGESRKLGRNIVQLDVWERKSMAVNIWYRPHGVAYNVWLCRDNTPSGLTKPMIVSHDILAEQALRASFQQSYETPKQLPPLQLYGGF